MSVTLTTATRQSLKKIKKEPSLAIKFDGITEIFGSATAFRQIKIGDAGLLIDGTWKIGERVAVPSQITAITFSSQAGATTTKIDYRLSPDLAIGESVTSFQIVLVDDKALSVLSLLAANEFLGRKCQVLLSPDSTDTVYPDDYITIFRGIVDDIALGSGTVAFTISHPDQKKRQTIYTSAESTLDEAVDISETTITLASTDNLIATIVGPDALTDGSLVTHIQVNDEIIRFTGISGNDITGCTRGALGTVAATHSSGDSTKSFYHFTGNTIDIALKLMLSGWNGNFKTGVEVTHFNYISDSEIVPKSMFFYGVNIAEEYGLTAGDYYTTVGASDVDNNQTGQIAEIVVTGFGSYVLLVGAEYPDIGFGNELNTPATVSFRSKYDTFGAGLKMSPDEVDVEEHERLRDLFLSSATFDGYVKDTIESGKDFISKNLYRPYACYSVPRKARSSMAYTVGPLPTDDIKTLSTSNVINADKITKKRSLGRNFYNTIIYKYKQEALTDEFQEGSIYQNATSKTQIPVGNRALIIEAIGLRSESVANSAANRRLSRYAFAADYINGVQVTLEGGYSIEVADLVVVDGISLKISDFDNASTTTEAKLYEVISKGFDLLTGRITLGLTNTNFTGADRFGLISPASYIKTGLSNTSFVIETSFASIYGSDEFNKWTPYGECYVRVHNSSFSVSATAQIDNFSGNTVTVKTSLGFTPSAGMLMEFSDYAQATNQIKLLFTHVTAGSANFSDGNPPYVMI